MSKTIEEYAKELAEKETDIMSKSVDNSIYLCEVEEALQNAMIQGSQYSLSHQWRSVEEELPEDNREVLVLCVGGCRSLGYFDYSEEMWFVNGFGLFDRNEIDFWMPIPSLPETNTEKI